MQRHPSPHALGPHALTHALAMASLLLAPATGWAAPGPQAGVSAAVRGSVLLGEVGQADAVGRAVADGDAVYLGNAIKAGPAAGMQLMLLDQTTVTLGENAELAVDEFIYDPAQNSGQISMNLTKGAFRLVTGGVSDINPANTKVKTPTATIGIRGTIVLANVSSAGTLIALGGPGPNADTRDRVGAVDVNTPQGSVSITRPGFATFVAPGQAPEPPRPLTPEESASLSGGLARDGSGSSESGNSGGGTTTEAGATRAVEESGTDSSESATAATVVSTQTDSTSTATDQTDSNTQSSEYGNNGAQLTSNVLVQQVLAAPEEEPAAEEEPPVTPPVPVQLSWAEMLQARGPSYTIARAADLAGLSGTANYTRLGAPLFDISGLDEDARNRLWLTSDFSGLNRVGSYDFSAAIDFALRRASANWTRIQIPGVTGYYTVAADTGDEIPPLLAYDESEQPVFRVEEETNVPTSYFARVRGAFITGTGDPNSAPGAAIQGLGIYVRNGSGGITPLYAGGGRANKGAAISLQEVVDADFTFLPNLEGGEYGQSRWSDLANVADGTMVFLATEIPLDYKDAAGDPWRAAPNSRFDFTGTIEFTARSFVYSLYNVVLSGTFIGDSERQTVSFDGRDGTAIDVNKNFAWRIGQQTDIVGSVKLSFYTNFATYPGSLLATDVFLATPGRLYTSRFQMNGTYTPPEPVEPPEDPTEDLGPPLEITWLPEITNADFTFVPEVASVDVFQSNWADLVTISNGTTVFSADYIPLNYKEAAGDPWKVDPSSRFDFTGTIDFAARSFAYGLNNVVLSGTNYGSSSMQTLRYGSLNGDAIDTRRNFAWTIGPRGDVTGSVKLSFYNDYGPGKPYPTGNASILALELFLATPGRLYYGTSQMTGSYRVPASPTPVVDTFDSSVFANFLVQEIRSTDEDVNSFSGYRATYKADEVSLEQRASGSNDPWTSGAGSYSFRADVDFDTYSYALSFYNIDIGGADRYRYDYSQTLEANTTGIAAEDQPLPAGPRNSTLSWEATFMNNYDGDQAIEIAQQLFIATEGTSYRGRSYAPRTTLEPTGGDEAPAVRVDPYDVRQSPQDAVYEALDVRLTKNGALDGGYYDLDATVSFMNRSITTSVEFTLLNGWSASGTSTQDFADENVSIDQAIYLSDQAILAPGSGTEVPGVTLNEVIITNGRPDESELVHSLQVLQGGDTYTGGSTTLATAP